MAGTWIILFNSFLPIPSPLLNYLACVITFPQRTTRDTHMTGTWCCPLNPNSCCCGFWPRNGDPPCHVHPQHYYVYCLCLITVPLRQRAHLHARETVSDDDEDAVTWPQRQEQTEKGNWPDPCRTKELSRGRMVNFPHHYCIKSIANIFSGYNM